MTHYKHSKEMLFAHGYEVRPNKYTCRCDCGASHLPEDKTGRVVRIIGGQNWVGLCKEMRCAAALIKSDGVMVGDSAEGLSEG